MSSHPMTKQAQVVRTEEVTETQSMTLMKNMIRIGISSICYHRGLFEPSCFKTSTYPQSGTAEQPVVTLNAAERVIENQGEDNEKETLIVRDERGFLLTQWIEQGVFQALMDKFLTEMTFAVFTRHPKTGNDLLLETYEFNINWSIDRKGKKKPIGLNSNKLTKSSLKDSANKFVRSLVSFASTLQDLPEYRFITLQLGYSDDCPEDYQPEFFEDATNKGLGKIIGPNILRCDFGHINTGHAAMAGSFHGVENLDTDVLSLFIDDSLSLPRDFAAIAPRVPKSVITKAKKVRNEVSPQTSARRSTLTDDRNDIPLSPKAHMDSHLVQQAAHATSQRTLLQQDLPQSQSISDMVAQTGSQRDMSRKGEESAEFVPSSASIVESSDFAPTVGSQPRKSTSVDPPPVLTTKGLEIMIGNQIFKYKKANIKSTAQALDIPISKVRVAFKSLQEKQFINVKGTGYCLGPGLCERDTEGNAIDANQCREPPSHTQEAMQPTSAPGRLKSSLKRAHKRGPSDSTDEDDSASEALPKRGKRGTHRLVLEDSAATDMADDEETQNPIILESQEDLVGDDETHIDLEDSSQETSAALLPPRASPGKHKSKSDKSMVDKSAKGEKCKKKEFKVVSLQLTKRASEETEDLIEDSQSLPLQSGGGPLKKHNKRNSSPSKKISRIKEPMQLEFVSKTESRKVTAGRGLSQYDYSPSTLE